MTITPSAAKTLPSWRFWLPLVCQAVLILAIPSQGLYTQITGRTVILKTAPVDPYDLLRGYSVTLNYDISQMSTLQRLPGWTEFEKQSRVNPDVSNDFFYLVLQAPKTADADPSQPWQAVRISRDRPTDLAANQVSLQGQISNSTIQYGLERYYIPEDQRDRINGNINAAQWNRGTQPIVVEVKVDAQGHAVPMSFWVTLGQAPNKQTYHYRF